MEATIQNVPYGEAFPVQRRLYGVPGVYVVEFESGLVKVGTAQNLHNRLSFWNRNHPIKSVIALYQISDPQERLAFESRLQALFWPCRAPGYERDARGHPPDHFTNPEAIRRILLSKIYS